jgi:16S rRNA (adenine1518-N6/adenine1519-N6)-dimethyltransferase
MYTLKKSLGQHFLKDEGVIERIIAALMEKPFTRLLEVGPGGGALTKKLIGIPSIDLKAVELDDEKIAFLQQQYPELQHKIIRGDILEIPKPFQQHFTIIGNFPYNISTQIMFRTIAWRDDIDTVIGMFQKEVAQRIAAGPNNKDYGILSVLLQAWFRVGYLFDVEPSCFNPPPKVVSGVIRLTNAGDPYEIADSKKFFLLVKTAFGQRRKQLRNPLKHLFPADVLQEDIFTRRAENLTVADYVALMGKMK